MAKLNIYENAAVQCQDTSYQVARMFSRYHVHISKNVIESAKTLQGEIKSKEPMISSDVTTESQNRHFMAKQPKENI